MSARTVYAAVMFATLASVAVVVLLLVLGGNETPEQRELETVPGCPEIWSVADAPCIHDTLPGDGYSYLIRRDGEVIELREGAEW